MGGYIQRYERVARECKNAGGGVLADEVKGLHLLGQVELSELKEEIVVGAYHTKDG